ncbi:MAG: histidinol dehydrogenase [Synergistaceae bacterium]|nr:histidinol dehydrogenase [Synergistaceae bacterium]
MIRITHDTTITRPKTQHDDISGAVRKILDDVRRNGDEALRRYAHDFDGVKLDAIAVSQAEIDGALKVVGEEYISLLERAANNIRSFHQHQKRNGFMYAPSEGVILGQRVMPLERVGLYVPGGTASYPSTVLMNAIPAKIAGCPHIYIMTPPNIKPEILAASYVAGVTRVYRSGGAQGIGALAYGTESIPRVDKITGPGNAYVAEAKRQVYGHVDIDMVAGPSEILIIADDTANPRYIASDMLAQSEHDKLASAILITTSETLAHSVCDEIEAQIVRLLRHDIARSSIDNNGRIIISPSINHAIDLANDIAPEHLELCVENAFDFLPSIHNAGSVFIGEHSPEALGDYYAGANHTLPTMGTARFSSPISVDDFTKKSQYIYYSPVALHEVAGDIEAFAMSEGLTGHAHSITVRANHV